MRKNKQEKKCKFIWKAVACFSGGVNKIFLPFHCRKTVFP
ncbi:hypothetical protein HMPREF3038_01414 [Akkermansia sp. KLE1797]|nr:hypothetical protein HMPREF3038_01414 [Akkermansia sp. KLE1797]KXU55426.1 hypothetical protein HMPREF3039_00323 [Akkermansia sp. KLE1798]KZA03485.1 hypothetical protein HMPREF1326_02914 [Akkermansia sp. KLE1605]